MEQLDQQLTGAHFPTEGLYLFGWFIELSSARGSTGFGPAPITYPDIEAWARLSGHRLTPWEVGTIKALDRAFLKVMGEK